MLSPRPRSMMRDGQRFIVRQMHEKSALLLVSSMGSGKTGAALTAALDMLDSFIIRRVLIIAPLRVASDTWPDEIRTWCHTRHLRFALAVGSEAERRVALDANAAVTIINRENLVWLARDYHGSVERWPYDCVIVDESSMFKAGKTRTKSMKVKRADGTKGVRKGGKITRFGVLAAARKKIDRIYLLTGTPSPNGLQDLWAQVYLLDQGERLGRSQSGFEKRWFHIDKATFKVEGPREGARDEIMGRIEDIMVSLPPLTEVPTPVFVPIRVILPDEVMKEYRRFRRTLVSQLHDVEAVSAGVLTNKLLQFTSGSMYREDGSVAPVHDLKLKALEDLVEESGGDNLLVFYGFKFDLEVIRDRFPDAVVLNESKTAVQDWNAGKIKMLLAHPASCAHGLNLQYGGHVAIWYGLTWSLELYQQANARLPRPGQQHQVVIYQIIAQDTVDERVLEVLSDKATLQDHIIKAVEREIAS